LEFESSGLDENGWESNPFVFSGSEVSTLRFDGTSESSPDALSSNEDDLDMLLTKYSGDQTKGPIEEI
jgi:hypothetical protein